MSIWHAWVPQVIPPPLVRVTTLCDLCTSPCGLWACNPLPVVRQVLWAGSAQEAVGMAWHALRILAGEDSALELG